MADLAKKLIRNHQEAEPLQRQAMEEMPLIQTQTINIALSNLIAHPKNRAMDESKIEEYALSIQEIGMIENPVVTPILEEPGKYMILSGHHRIAACHKLAETDTRYNIVCCKVVNKDEIDSELVLLHGNIMHNPLSPYEKMMAIGREEELLKLKQEKGTLRSIISHNTGLKPTQVQTNLTVYKKAIPEVKEALRLERITLEKARALAVMPQKEQQRQIMVQKQRKSTEVIALEKEIDKVLKIQKAINEFRYDDAVDFPLKLSDKTEINQSFDGIRKSCSDYIALLEEKLDEFVEAQNMAGTIACKICKYNQNMECSLRVKYGNGYTCSGISPSEIRPVWCPRVKH